MIIKRSLEVTLEQEGQETAVFEFKKTTAKKICALQTTEAKDLKSRFFMLVDDLISVTGLYDDAGNAISVDELRDLDLDITTINAIIEGYSAKAFPNLTRDPEKKIS